MSAARGGEPPPRGNEREQRSRRSGASPATPARDPPRGRERVGGRARLQGRLARLALGEVIRQRLAGALRLAPRGEVLGEQGLHERAERDRRYLEALLPREGLELDLQRLRRRRPSGGLARERPHDDRGERGRVRTLARPARRLGRLADDLVQDVEVVRRREGRLARRELVEDRAEREHVAARVELFASALLGRHVGELALERALLRLRALVRPLRDAEVRNLDGAVVRHEDVRRRDVAVDDVERLAAGAALFVRVVQAGRRRGDDPDGVRQRKWRRLPRRAVGGRVGDLRLRLHELAQVRAEHVLHREERRLAVRADVVDLGDVRVRERRREARLVEEHAQQLGLEGVLRQDALDDDELLETFDADAGQPREVDLGHAPDGEPPDELVAAELLAARVVVRDGGHPASG